MKKQVFKVLHHVFPRSLFALAITEIFILVAAYSIGLHIYTESSAIDTSYAIEFLIALLWAFLVITSMMTIGLYWRDNIQDKIGRLFRIIASFAIGFLMLSITLKFFYKKSDLNFDSDIFLVFTGLGFVGVLLVRSLFYAVVSQDFMKKKILVIGAGEKASQLLEPEMQDINFVGFIPFSDNFIKLPNERLLAHSIPLVDIAKNYDVDGIVVALDERRNKIPVEELIECKMNGIKILELSEFFEIHRKQLNINDLTPSSIIFSNGFRRAILRSKSKRFFDLVVSFLLLIIVLPIILVAVIAILIESKGNGPIIYRQARVGKDGKPFEVLKLRTMRVDAEKNGKAQWASKDDPRVTTVGRVLRKYRIDELPQLINVTRGEMSFVGPRPERPEFVEGFGEKIPFYQLRHRIKPGITGWAQICYPYGDSEKDAREKLQYDLFYIKNYSLLLDMNILLQTAHTVLWGRGAR
ncbi:MAG: TIGR03013 family PEP-CTERM/XrtA system glycosyltransferase [Gammaproteobacteria bacterium]